MAKPSVWLGRRESAAPHQKAKARFSCVLIVECVGRPDENPAFGFFWRSRNTTGPRLIWRPHEARPLVVNLTRFTLSIAFGLVVVLWPAAVGGANKESHTQDPIHHYGGGTGALQAVVVDDVPLVHTTQVLPVGPDGELSKSGDFKAQAEQVLNTLASVLQAANSALARTVKLNVYVANPEFISEAWASLQTRFPGSNQPAATVIVTTLPKDGALVAMDAVAVAEESSPAVKFITNPAVEKDVCAAAVLPAGSKIYLSGMADTNALPQATRKTLEKLMAALSHLGLQKTDVVQLKAFLEPMANAELVRKEVIEFFGESTPPLVLVEWRSPSPNPPIEIELIAKAKRDPGTETETVSFLTPPGTTSTKVFSRVARVNHGKLIYMSGLSGRVTATRDIFTAIRQISAACGSDLEHLVKATYYVSSEEASKAVNDIRPEFFNPQRPPAASKAMMASVPPSEKTAVMVDMIAVTK